MAKLCERCKQARMHLSMVFATLILLNFVGRSLLDIETTTLLDVLLLPSFGLIVSAVILYIFINNKVK